MEIIIRYSSHKNSCQNTSDGNVQGISRGSRVRRSMGFMRLLGDPGWDQCFVAFLLRLRPECVLSACLIGFGRP